MSDYNSLFFACNPRADNTPRRKEVSPSHTVKNWVDMFENYTLTETMIDIIDELIDHSLKLADRVEQLENEVSYLREKVVWWS